MLITVRNVCILKIFGWKSANNKYPSYVTASHKAWLRWLFRLDWKRRSK